MPSNPRVTRAFHAMRDLEISEEKVKPVLKNLLKLYDKNWELIEEENYRVLADAIFDNDEAQAAENKKKLQNSQQERDSEEEAQEPSELDRPLKRLRLRNQGSQASQPGMNTNPGLAGTSLVRPKDEPIDLPEIGLDRISRKTVCPGQPNNGSTRTESPHISSQSLDRNKRKEPVAPDSLRKMSGPSEPVTADKIQSNVLSRNVSNVAPHPMLLRNRQKEILSPQITSGERRLDSERPSHAVHHQEPRIDSGIILTPKPKIGCSQVLIKPKEEPFTDDMLPLAVVPPETSRKRDSSKKNSSTIDQDGCEPIASKPLAGNHSSDGVPALSERTGTNIVLAKVPEESSFQLQIASSSSGGVKISFNIDIPPNMPNFHLPSPDAAVTYIENRCLRSDKVLDPKLSLMKLMEDMRECVLELGTGSCSKSPETIKVTPPIDMLKEARLMDPFVAEGMPFSTLNGFANAQSVTEAALPQTLQLHLPCNGVHDSIKPDKNASAINKGGYEENEQNGLDDTNSMSTVLVQQPQLTLDQIRALYDVSDITKGLERVVISLVNEINSECPPSFHYIPRNAVFQNAHVNYSLARIGDNNCCSSCSGDCLPLGTPCACAHETGGEFAYTTEGFVKEEFLEECVSMNRDPERHCQFFCKECPLERSKDDDIVEPCRGHLVRKFIKECWWKCGCDSSCSNRVVQRGITRNLQVFMTERKGWGLRTLEDLPKGAFVCEYVGEVLTNAELFDRVSKSIQGEVHSYPVLLDADWVTEGVLKDDEALCLDATYYGNVARFINHRCFDSNLVEIPVELETPDHHYYHLAFFTTRKVQAMEELTWDYGIDFDDLDHPVKAFRCQCGSKCCRNIRRPSRSIVNDIGKDQL